MSIAVNLFKTFGLSITIFEVTHIVDYDLPTVSIVLL